MKLILGSEQKAIQESARRFFGEVAPVDAFRALRDAGERGYDAGTWQQMSELGYCAITIPEAYGGLGLDYVTLGAVIEEAGRTLCASPLFASLALGASAIELCGTEAQKNAVLPVVALGELTLALAIEEGHCHGPANISFQAQEQQGGFILTGRKTFVLDGNKADKIVVLAQVIDASGSRKGLSFFLVGGEAHGLARHAVHLVDSRDTASLEFAQVHVPADARLGDGTVSELSLELLLDRARAVIAAEMIGGVRELFERTLAYMAEREQFGVKIASFQALRHRVAKLYTEIELARSAVLAALWALDNEGPDRSALVSLAKSRANDVYTAVSNEAIQLHGGIGMTDELDLGLFLKRACVAVQMFGDSRFHRRRFATLHGY